MNIQLRNVSHQINSVTITKYISVSRRFLTSFRKSTCASCSSSISSTSSCPSIDAHLSAEKPCWQHNESNAQTVVFKSLLYQLISLCQVQHQIKPAVVHSYALFIIHLCPIFKQCVDHSCVTISRSVHQSRFPVLSNKRNNKETTRTPIQHWGIVFLEDFCVRRTCCKFMSKLQEDSPSNKISRIAHRFPSIQASNNCVSMIWTVRHREISLRRRLLWLFVVFEKTGLRWTIWVRFTGPAFC